MFKLFFLISWAIADSSSTSSSVSNQLFSSSIINSKSATPPWLLCVVCFNWFPTMLRVLQWQWRVLQWAGPLKFGICCCHEVCKVLAETNFVLVALENENEFLVFAEYVALSDRKASLVKSSVFTCFSFTWREETLRLGCVENTSIFSNYKIKTLLQCIAMFKSSDSAAYLSQCLWFKPLNCLSTVVLLI